MKIILSSQNLELLSAVQQRVEKKLQTLERFTRKFGPDVCFGCFISEGYQAS